MEQVGRIQGGPGLLRDVCKESETSVRDEHGYSGDETSPMNKTHKTVTDVQAWQDLD